MVNRRAARWLGCLAMAVAWWWAMAPSRLNLDGFDWPRDVAYFAVLRASLHQWRLPLTVGAPIFNLGTSVPGNLELPLGPQFFAACLLPTAQAVALATALSALVGAFGCLRLARRFSLSTPAALWLMIGLLFNGTIAAHLSAGHLGWLSAFYLPFVFDALLDADADDPRRAWRSSVLLAISFAAMILCGGVHVAVQTAVFVGAVFVVRAPARVAIVRGLLWAAGVSAWRLVPAAFVFAHGGRPWLAGGVPSARTFADALLVVRSPLTEMPVDFAYIGGVIEHAALPWVSFDAYIGGVLAVLVVAFALPWRHARLLETTSPAVTALRRFEWPIVVSAALALGQVYEAFVPAPVSLLSVVRVPSRFLLPGLMAVIVVAVVRADCWWRSRRRDPFDTWLPWIAVGASTAALAYHAVAVSAWRTAYPAILSPLAPPVLTNVLSARDVAVYGLGGLMSAASVVGCVWADRRARVRAIKKPATSV